MKPAKRVVVTGGAGQIAYSLLFRIAQGELFGPEQPVCLHLLDLPAALESLKGVQMELSDCAFGLLQEIRIGDGVREMFEEVDVALLIGARPRGRGMERKDLLEANGTIFVEQGRALNDVAHPAVKVLVVGNPCNTNALIAMHHAPKLSSHQFFAMTRLDQNRAVYQLAAKAQRGTSSVSNMAIWGNHSNTQVPDFINAQIDGKPVCDVIGDRHWLETSFFETVQKRGAQVIETRGSSSAASAAHAVIESIRSIYSPTPENNCFSLAVHSKGNSYGVDENLIFSFPCSSKGAGDASIQEGFQLDTFLEEKIKLTEKELIEERDCVAHLLKGL